MIKEEEMDELLQILEQNGVKAVIEAKKNGPELCVFFKYPLSKISDYKGLAVRLTHFKELGYEGL